MLYIYISTYPLLVCLYLPIQMECLVMEAGPREHIFNAHILLMALFPFRFRTSLQTLLKKQKII